ncbi:MAG: class I SAM-dependent methyltransferase [Rhodospirillales bacterium]|nr:class I SAM-dependent methyltransferase [Rhodospirillales bacterium]
MDNSGTQKKWDAAAASFDLLGGFGPEKRWKADKQRFFSTMDGKILFLAVGTGLDIQCFPSGKDITGIDISPKMLAKAMPRVEAYPGQMTARQMDVHDMDFPDDTFDQVFTSCTFCSVPEPLKGLSALRRVLKPGGTLKMFEHTGSTCFPFSTMLNVVNPLFRNLGPELNRDTVANVRAAGFEVQKVSNIFLDVVKTIEAIAPVSASG